MTIRKNGFASRAAIVGASLLTLGLVAGFVAGIAGEVSAEEHRSIGRGGVADLVRSIISKKPNMVIEDHAEISCEREFSVKLFTSEKLTAAEFDVFDAASGAPLYGPLAVAEISPLWETIPLGPLSALPPKIVVKMKALAPDGETRTDKLILEPDCDEGHGHHTVTSITKKVVIIHPVGKWLWNPPPWPPFPPFDPLDPQYTRVPLTVAVPTEAIGKPLVATMVWQDPTGVRRYLAAETQTIQTELVALELRSANPIPVGGGPQSFFDVFVEVSIGTPKGPGLTRALSEGTLSLPHLDPADHVMHPDGSMRQIGGTFDSFFDVFTELEFVRMIDATPLEYPSTGITEHGT